MKRLFLSAAAAALFASPALAQTDQGQYRHNAPAHSEHPSTAPAPHAYAPPPSHAFVAPVGHPPSQGFAPAFHPPQTGVPGSARTFVPGSHLRPLTDGQQTAPYQTFHAPGTPSSQYGAYRSYQGAGQHHQYQGSGQNQGSGQYQGNNWDRGHYRNNGNWWRGGQYQGNNWDRNHYRNDGDWWRGRHGFERYRGHRYGFWFAPGWGYYQVDPQWYGYDWEVGVEVPYNLRGYYVDDPYDYGLPPAPYGCAWIYLGDEIVLIDLNSGEILQIADSY
jgi:Ni/Co efflux regulator RcnB